MPLFTRPDGIQTRIPGVYGAFEVVSSLPGALPAFQIPLILAGGEWGYPFDIHDTNEDHETLTEFQWFGTPDGAKAFYGQDSDMGVAFATAARHGMPGAFGLCMSALTRASLIATSVGPINQAKVYSRRYGWPGNWIMLKVAGGLQVDVTVPTRFTRLSANAAGTATRIYVRDNSWVQIGATYSIGDNNTALVTKTVADKGTSYTATGQKQYWVEFTAAIGGAITTALYAAIAQYPTTATESSDTFTTAQQVFDWIRNESQWIDVVEEATWSGVTWIALAAATPIKEIAVWAAPVKAVSPSPSSTDYDDMITDMGEAEWDRFVTDYGVIPRLFLVVDSATAVHTSMRDWTIAKRLEGWPIAVVTGRAWGDIVAQGGGATDPTVNARTLNHQDFMLCAGGLDWLGAYASLAPVVFGLRAGKPVGHNLTNDDIFYEMIEAYWDERVSGDLTALLRAGVCTYKLSVSGSPRFRIAEGLSTLSNNDNAWNTVDATTCLVAQRDLADFVDRVIRLDLEGMQLGADEVDPSTIAAVINRRAEKSLKRRGYIKDFRIDSITLDATGAGYNVEWSVKLPTTTDFIGLTTRILIG